MGAAPDVSICILTYRRPAGLARLLDSIERLKRPTGVSFEVVIVDNDPDSPESATPSLADIPVRRLRQACNQLAGGRNRTVSEARGTWVAFVDDDEELHEDWLLAFHEASERFPLADGFLGNVEARFEEPGPAWIDVATFYQRGRQGSDGPVDPRLGHTANAWLRRRLFEEVSFDPSFDRTGGEDADLFLQLSARGARILWCGSARVVDWIPPHRHCARRLLRRSLEAGNAHAQLLRRHSRAGPARHIARSIAAAWVLLCLLPFAAIAGRRQALRVARRLNLQVGRMAGFAGRELERDGL